MQILIGYDGSDCAREAIEDLQRAALPEKADALILSVAEVWPHLPESCLTGDLGSHPGPTLARAHEIAAVAVTEAHRQAAEGALILRGLFPQWDITEEVTADSPTRAIIRKIEAWGADLVVLGSQGKSAISRLLLGSVSQSIVLHAPCSVRVARKPPQSHRGPLRIIIGTDGSSDAAAAVHWVARRHWPAGSEARVVSAADVAALTAVAAMGSPLQHWAVDDLTDRTWVIEAINNATDILRESGLHVSSQQSEGDPKQVLLREAEHFDADCIFVGARGLSRLDRFLLGSVSATVAARATCSVEVVRAFEITGHPKW